MRDLSRAATLLAALALLAPDAAAKGEGGGNDVPCEQDAPRAYAVRFPADEASPIAIATNFGLLLSRDGGERWSVVCPQAIAFAVQPNALQPPFATPTVALLPGGALLATRAPIGLYRSADGCAWEAVSDPDVASYHVASTTVLADGTVFASTDSGGSLRAVLHSDDGVAFAPTALQSTTFAYGSLSSAPDGAAVYAVSTLLGPAGYQTLHRSDDAGETWTDAATFDTGAVGVAAVDPLAPARLVLRRRGLGFCAFDDAVLVSEDGGASLAEGLVLDDDAMTGALFRPDGAVWVASVEGGLRRSSDGGATWAAVPGVPRARCLVGTTAEIWACLPVPDDALGLVARSRDEGESWEQAVAWDRIDGPPDCLADTCGEHWQSFLAAWRSGAPAGDGGAPPGGDGGGLPVYVPPDAGGDAPRDAPPSGCGCLLARGPTARAPLLALLAALLAAPRRRRR